MAEIHCCDVNHMKLPWYAYKTRHSCLKITMKFNMLTLLTDQHCTMLTLLTDQHCTMLRLLTDQHCTMLMLLSDQQCIMLT